MATVTFQKSNVSAAWTGEAGSILELGEAQGLDLPFGCRQGMCTKCQQPLASGEVDYPNGHESEPNEGNILLCCSVPKGDVTIDA